MNRTSFLLLQVLAVDLGTVLVFATLHQVFIAWTIGPFGASLFGIIPAGAVVWAWTAWGPQRPDAWKLGLAAAAAGVLPWLVVQAMLSGDAYDEYSGWLSLGADVAAGLLAGSAAFALTHRVQPAVACALAVFLAFGFASPFLVGEPLRWVSVRALLCLGAGVVAGAVALGLATRRLQRLVRVPAKAVVA